MSEERESLADQALAWVPPWDRSPQQPTDRGDRVSDTSDMSPDATEAGLAEAAVAEAGDQTAAVEDEAVEPVATADLAGVVAEAGDDPGEAQPRGGWSHDDRFPMSDMSPGTGGTGGTVSAAAGEGRVEAVATQELAALVAEASRADGDRVAPSTLALLDEDELRGALEAILLVVDEPVAEVVLAQILEQPAERVVAALEAVAAGYTAAGHGFELRRAAGGWRLYTRAQYAAYVERYVLDGQSVRLTQAALETLAVVAYKQPVTRSRISAVRGVNCDGVIRTLTNRGLVEECGTEPETGAYLYRTTTLFLEKLGLDSVAE